jgi:glycosyltransferase involved in cell wall biosynthesis
MPHFSIIIPTYNRANMLSSSIESVLNQTFNDWELIVVDDGSTDNTKELMGSFIQKDPRIKYIYQENSERSAARNFGIKNAKGQYICFLDSDDVYLDNNLEAWYNFLERKNTPVALGFCEMNISSDNGRSLVTTNTVISNRNKYDFIFTNPIVPARICVHSNLLKNNLFEEYMTVGEDVALWLKVVVDSDIIKSEHIGLNYIIHEGNSVNPKNPSALKMYNGFMRFFKKHPELKKRISVKVYNHYVSKIQTNIAKHYYRNGKKTKAVFELIKAVIRSPIHEHTKYRLRLIVLTSFSRNPNLYE